MAHTTPRWLPLVLIAAGTLLAARAAAQTGLPPAPIPVTVPEPPPPSPPPATLPAPTVIPNGPASPAPAAPSIVVVLPSGPPPLGLTPPPPPGSVIDVPGLAPPTTVLPAPPPPGTRYDPIVDAGHVPGWFGGFDLAVLQPHVKFNLKGTVDLGDLGPVTIQPPYASLDWAVAPRIELGYRFPEGCGEFLFGYRFLSTEGRGRIPQWDAFGDGDLKSRLDANVVDLDYASHEDTWGPLWDIKWRAGLRFATNFFDSQIAGPTVAESASNRFYGAGPHLGLDLTRRLYPASGLDFFVRTDGALVIGRVSQEFDGVAMLSDTSVIGGGTSIDSTQTMPMFLLQAGLGWRPASLPDARFTVGYQYEYWWKMGHLNNSTADIWFQGVYVRGEIRY